MAEREAQRGLLQDSGRYARKEMRIQRERVMSIESGIVVRVGVLKRKERN